MSFRMYIIMYIFADMNQEQGIEIGGMAAMMWARELSRLPHGDFTLVFFPYSRERGEADHRLVTKEHCKWRPQMHLRKMDIDSDNLLCFTDQDGKPRACWRILIRYMAFSQDGYKLHKINWLGNE